jgi:murein DD-endopeptidase MepM/ murein hydrolase activator NlpD
VPRRHWTILIVPSDNERARSYTVTDRTRKTLLWIGGLSGTIVVAAAGFLFTPYTTPAGRMLLAENERLRGQMQGLDARFSALADTINAIGQRDRQIRALAGLSVDSVAVSSGPVEPRLDDAGTRVATFLPSAPRSKPFLNRLGFGGASPDIDELSRRAGELAQSFRAVSDTLNKNLERVANTPSIMPTTGWLSSHFSQSRMHPILHENRPHEGIDVSAPMGAPIIAPATGVVRNVTYEAGYGNSFEIDHGNGIVTKFAHCSRIIVHNGQLVQRSQLIATVGNTGLSVGPHLHYEVHVNGKPVDPLRYVLPEKIAD